MVAPKFKLDSDDVVLTPYWNNLTIFENDSNTEIKMEGTNWVVNGIVFAPGANLVMKGDNYHLFNGFAEALTVEIIGDNWTLAGTGPTMVGPGTQLIG